MHVCRYHGARKPSSIKSGKAHWNYQHGRETLHAKAERSKRLAELHELEEVGRELGIIVGPKWRGRRPKWAKGS